jgi:hypothetical protein
MGPQEAQRNVSDQDNNGSPMFGPEIVDLYKKQNEKYDPVAPIKSKEAAESLR